MASTLYGNSENSASNDYYNQWNVLNFSYEGEDYSVTVGKVIVCPQCYSAIPSRLGNMKSDYLIVDIGSKTTDVVYEFLAGQMMGKKRSVFIRSNMADVTDSIACASNLLQIQSEDGNAQII